MRHLPNRRALALSPLAVLLAVGCGGNVDAGPGARGVADASTSDSSLQDDATALDSPLQGDSTGFDVEYYDAPDDPPEELCALQEGPIHSYCSKAELLALLLGRWWFCEGTPPAAFLAKDQVGVEFAPAGDFYLLKLDGQGKAVRGYGFDYEGKWSLHDSSSEDNLCFWQLNLDSSMGGGVAAFPAFSDSPRKLLLPVDSLGSRYVAIH